MVYRWLLNTLSTLCPSHCYLCECSLPAGGICLACQEDLPVLQDVCTRCGISLAAGGGLSLCAQCLRDPPPYTRVICALAYTAPASRLITGLKFHRQLHVAPLLAQLLLARLGDVSQRVEAILPVPLHPRRLRQRGFNQALEIARPLAGALRMPLLAASLHRVRETAPQSLQPSHERASNVRNAFALREIPQYRRVALVDDVMTSGHTAREAARCLLAAGIETVEVWCAARASSKP